MGNLIRDQSDFSRKCLEQIQSKSLLALKLSFICLKRDYEELARNNFTSIDFDKSRLLVNRAKFGLQTEFLKGIKGLIFDKKRPDFIFK